MKQTFAALFFCLFATHVFGQQQFVSGPEPRGAVVRGTVTDTDGSIIPGAEITAEGATPTDTRKGVSTSDGSFVLEGLAAAVAYRVTIHAKGFLDWTSQPVTLHPGEDYDLEEVKLSIGIVETSVSAITSEQLAVEQEQLAVKQRILGIIPNFYVVYDPRYAPLSTKLKFKLATRASIDVVSIGGAALLAGINQASDSAPSYKQGATGYAKRFGSAYGGGVATVMLGGAILPSLLHQDPRYFYQGTGTKKSRAMHAIMAPFQAKSDKDGHWEFNYSSIGGDLMAGALANAYYPEKDRGPGLVFGGAAVATGGRIVNALAQEFILRKLTTHNQPKD